jgi:hypothetical protein
MPSWMWFSKCLGFLVFQNPFDVTDVSRMVFRIVCLENSTIWARGAWLRWQSSWLAAWGPEYKPKHYKKRKLAIMVHLCNLSYAGGRGRRILSLRSALGKVERLCAVLTSFLLQEEFLFIYLFIYFGGTWGLNSRLHTSWAGVLQFELCLQLWLF